VRRFLPGTKFFCAQRILKAGDLRLANALAQPRIEELRSRIPKLITCLKQSAIGNGQSKYYSEWFFSPKPSALSAYIAINPGDLGQRFLGGWRKGENGRSRASSKMRGYVKKCSDQTDMAKTTNIHVVHRNDGWVVRKEGTSRATSVHQTQRDAVDAARKIARNQSGELVIHGRDGRIRGRDSYGTDPMPLRYRQVLFPNKPASASEKAIKEAVSAVVDEKTMSTKSSSRSPKH
jgi:Uncharacterized protein conserved in bacteria (DUF2188)